MHTDTRGHEISTASEAAAAHLSKAIDSFVERQADAGAHMQAALAADTDCAFSHALMGLMLHGARTIQFRAQAEAELQAAKQHAAHISAREQLFIDALSHALAGQLVASAQCMEAVLTQHPTDLLALVLFQSELFWLGEMAWSARVSAALVQHWNVDIPGYPAFLAVRAFDLEEAGAYTDSERFAREALELNPKEVWGSHSLAHIMLMQNRIDEGVTWMRERESNWQSANQMQFHLAWHQCLFLIERREHDEMLRIYDSRVRNRQHPLCEGMPDLYIDLQNASSVLWRLEQAGVDVGNRWEELADVCQSRTSDMSNPFTSAHFAIILAATQQHESCQKLISAMESFAAQGQHDLAARYQTAALPTVKAAIAHRLGKHAEVVRVLTPALGELWKMGGSHAQRDVFFQLLSSSTAHCGDEQGQAQLMDVVEQIGFVEPGQRVAYSAAH